MRILFSSVVIEDESPEIVGIFDQQLQLLRCLFSLVKRIAEDLWGESASIYRKDFHPWPNACMGRVHSFDGVFDLAILFNDQPDRERGIERAMVIFPCPHHR